MLGITFQWFVSVKRNKEIVQYSLHMYLTYPPPECKFSLQPLELLQKPVSKFLSYTLEQQ